MNDITSKIQSLIDEQASAPAQVRPVCITMEVTSLMEQEQEQEQEFMTAMNCTCSASCGSNFSQNGSCPCSSSCGSNYSH